MTARIAIVGGGLAGLAAAAALADCQASLTLIESRRRLGGRAASFVDPQSGELVDQCQHVSMGCCTNFDDFCRRTGLAGRFRHDRVLHFFGRDGRECRFAPVGWLPAPLHVGPALWRMKFLRWQDRLSICRAMWRLVRWSDRETLDSPTMREWLVARGQSAAAIDDFWSVILVSALGETLDRVAVSAARKVIVDGFFSSHAASVVQIPTVPLGELYGAGLEAWFSQRSVALRLGLAVKAIEPAADRWRIMFAGGELAEFDFVVLATTWRQYAELLDESVRGATSCGPEIQSIASAPIAGVHLWFDRAITDLPHAVLVGRLSQWVFRPGASGDWPATDGHYYQVVISGAHDLEDRSRDELVRQVVAELATIWPSVADAKLLRSRVVNDPNAVYSIRPGLSAWRPSQRTAKPGLVLAGDWTQTGWPATMEGAVRSGYLSAEEVCRQLGQARRFLRPDLPRGRLASWLLRGTPSPSA